MSSLNLNRVVLAGHLTADVELKQSTSGAAVCSFTLAINRRTAKESAPQTDFITIVAWRQTAELVARYFRKGSAMCLWGSIQTRSWQTKDGQRRFATEVVADEVLFVDSKNAGGAENNMTMGSAVPSAIDTLATPNFEPLSDDDDVPF